MAEAPDVNDLAQTLRLASDTLARKAEIARQIAVLRAEDASLNAIIGTWVARVDDMREQLVGLFQAMPNADQLQDNVFADQIDKFIQEINEI